MSMFTFRQKLLLSGSVLISALLIAGSYFGSRWLHGPDVEPFPEHLLSDGPHAVSTNHAVRAAVSQYTPSVFESQSVSDIDSTLEAEQNYDDEEEELETLLNSLSDEEFTALAESLEQEEGKDFPQVPTGFPFTPIWLKDNFHERDNTEHVTLYRVMIELWNRGDRGFVNGVSDSRSGKIYPIYPDVVYVRWGSYVREGPDGVVIEVPYVSRRLGTASTVNSLVNSDEKLFTEEEIISGAYRTKFPGIKFVDFDNAGYNPATILDDY